jgi:hypothetical protein
MADSPAAVPVSGSSNLRIGMMARSFQAGFLGQHERADGCSASFVTVRNQYSN